MALLCFGCAALLWCIEPKYIFASKEISLYPGNNSFLKYSPEYEKGMKIANKLERFFVSVNGELVPSLFSNSRYQKRAKALDYIFQDIEEKGFPEDESEVLSIMTAVVLLSKDYGRLEERRAVLLQLAAQFPEGSCVNHWAHVFLDITPEDESCSAPFHTTAEILHMHFRAIVRELFVLLCIMGVISLFIAVRRRWRTGKQGLATTEDESASPEGLN